MSDTAIGRGPELPGEPPIVHVEHLGNHVGYACGFSGPHCWECGELWPCRGARGVPIGTGDEPQLKGKTGRAWLAEAIKAVTLVGDGNVAIDINVWNILVYEVENAVAHLSAMLHDAQLGCRRDYRGDRDCPGVQYHGETWAMLPRVAGIGQHLRQPTRIPRARLQDTSFT